MTVKELITQLLELPMESNIDVCTNLNCEETFTSFPIESVTGEDKYCHIKFNNFDSLTLKGE